MREGEAARVQGGSRWLLSAREREVELWLLLEREGRAGGGESSPEGSERRARGARRRPRLSLRFAPDHSTSCCSCLFIVLGRSPAPPSSLARCGRTLSPSRQPLSLLLKRRRSPSLSSPAGRLGRRSSDVTPPSPLCIDSRAHSALRRTAELVTARWHCSTLGPRTCASGESRLARSPSLLDEEDVLARREGKLEDCALGEQARVSSASVEQATRDGEEGSDAPSPLRSS